MARPVRILQLVLPVVFIGFLVIIYLSYSGGKRQSRPDAKFTVPARPSDTAQTVAESFDDVQTIGGKVVLRIRAKRTVAFRSGWVTLEDVHLTVYRPNGQTYELSCEEAVVNSTTKEAHAKGGVRLATSDGMELQTEAIDYDGKQIANKIPVRFKVDQWVGGAGGLNLDVGSETLTLSDKFDAVSQPQKPGEPAVRMASQRAVFKRDTGNFELTGGVTLTRGPDVVRADVMTSRFDQKSKKMASLEGHDNVIMDLSANSPGLAGGAATNAPTHITAERFFSEMGGQGEIIALNIASDRQPVLVTMEGAPRRTLASPKFRIVVPGGVIEEIQADGIVMTEQAAVPRVVTAKNANLYFDKIQRRPLSLYLQNQVVFTDGKMEGRSDRANYDLTSRRLVLSAMPQSAPVLKTETETLRATIIEVLGNEQVMKANGAVYAELHQKGTTAAANALFPEKGPIYVNADNAVFQRVNRTAQFTGNVRTWQGSNTLFAKQLNVVAEGEVLTALGDVRGSLLNASKSGPQRTTPVLTKSDQLIAKRRDRRVDLEGNVRIDDEGRQLQSEKATIFLDARQKIDRVEATGKINIAERASGRKGTGEKALYKLAEKMLWLEGTPATMADPQGTIKGTQIVFDIDRNKVQVLSGASPTEATYNPK